MTRWMNQVTRVWKNETCYLQCMMVIFFIIPVLYFAYLSMSAAMLQTDIMTLLTQSTKEGINLIVNVSMFYGAYALHEITKQSQNRGSCIALGLLFLSQLCFLNTFTIVMMIFFVTNFIGWKQLKHYYQSIQRGWNWRIILPSVLLLVVSMITLMLKLKLQMLM